MKSNVAFVDEPLAARDFGPGDVVRRMVRGGGFLSPYVGRVVFSNRSTGKVEVQWPWGSEQESPTELVRDTSGHFPPSSADQTYVTWDAVRSVSSLSKEEIGKLDDASAWKRILSSDAPLSRRIASAYEARTAPMWRAACESWHRGESEMEAFDRVASTFGDEFGYEAARVTVSNLYGLGRHLALYWKDNKRRYRVTQKEKSSGKMTCPRCKNTLKPHTYRAGQRVHLCRTCGFSIHPKDLV